MRCLTRSTAEAEAPRWDRMIVNLAVVIDAHVSRHRLAVDCDLVCRANDDVVARVIRLADRFSACRCASRRLDMRSSSSLPAMSSSGLRPWRPAALAALAAMTASVASPWVGGWPSDPRESRQG